ncbi:MAG: hypothetical protein AAB400_04145 [Patescibacteria group bacterium]
MTLQSVGRIVKKTERFSDLQSTLDVRDSELRAEREETKRLTRELESALKAAQQAKDELGKLQARFSQEQSGEAARVAGELEALKRDTAFWTRAVPDRNERIELSSLFEWQLSSYGRIAEASALIDGRHELISEVQRKEREASRAGKQEDFDKFRELADSYYAEIRQHQAEIDKQRAIIATKIVPMIERVMTSDPRSIDDDIQPDEDVKDDTDRKELEQGGESGSQDSAPEVYHPTIQIHQPLTALDRYKHTLVFAGCEHIREIIDLLQWLISENFATKLSKFLILIEEDAYETRVGETAKLKKWNYDQKNRACKLIRLLLDGVPIWTSNELSERRIFLRIDREEKLQQFLQTLDERFRRQVQDQENTQVSQQKPLSPPPIQKCSVAKPAQKYKGFTYSGKKVSLHRDLVGKEDQFLEYVPTGHFLGSIQAGVSYGKLRSCGYVENFEQTLREASRGELSKRIEKKLVTEALPEGKTINGIMKSAMAIESHVQQLDIFNSQQEFDRGKAIERAYAILISKEGYDAFTVRRATTDKRHSTSLSPAQS